MTDNQEKELFSTLAALVTGVNIIQSDVKELKSDVGTLKSDVGTLKSDVREIKVTLNEHSQILNEHSKILKHLDAKTDSIAEVVLRNDRRLTNVEKDVAELKGGIH